MAKSRKKAQVTVSFQVTFPLPEGITIQKARELLKCAVRDSGLQPDPDKVKCHLTNKEIKYA